MKEKLKELASSKIGLAVIAFFLGGLAATFLLPEKIVIKTNKETEYVDRVVEKEVIKYVDRVVEKVVTKTEKVKTVKRKETFPDGHTIEEEIFESESEQIDRLRQEEQERYKEMLVQREREFREKEESLKVHYNPKSFTVFGGAGVEVTDPLQSPYYLAGVQASVWGPFTIGAEVTTDANVAATVGLRF